MASTRALGATALGSPGRALLADRPVLLIDEPTAHLDPATADSLGGEVLAATAGRPSSW